MSGERLFRRLLALLPAGFREEMGEAMAEHAVRRARDRRRPAPAFWLREYAGLARVALQEHARAAGHARIRTTRSGYGMDTLRELRFAARRLRRAPGFAAAALLTLSLALGAVASIWAVVKNVVLDPLPYSESDALVLLEHGLPGIGAARGVNITEGLHSLYRDQAGSLESVAMYTARSLTLTGAGEPELLEVFRATPSLARVLRVQPALGRWFDADAGREGGAREVVLSHALWSTRFGSDPGTLGTTILLDDSPYEVIGVMPRDFRFQENAVQAWLPLAEPGADARVGGFNYWGLGRMSSGATLTALRSEMDGLIARLPDAFPDADFAHRLIDDAQLNAQPVLLRERVVGSVAQTLWVLLATVGLVLILACANVANLFLVRSDARQTELAVRRALGAGRRGIIAQFMAESLILCGIGGAAGLGIAYAAVRLLRAKAPAQLPRVAEIGVDGGVVTLALALCVVVALALGILPRLRRQPTLADAVQEAGRRTSAGAARVRARALLVATQVALASVLLVACGLMARSFIHLAGVDHGFDAHGVLTFHVGLPAARYPEAADAARFHEQLVERLGGLPGVESAAAISCAPLEGWCYGDPLQVEGRTSTTTPPVVSMRMATPSYFETLSIRLRRGRAFTAAEANGAVALVNQALVQLYFPDEDPIAKRVQTGPAEFAGSWATIVGVVDNTATHSVTEGSPAPSIYFPMGFVDSEVGISRHNVTYVVRASTPPLGLLPAVREALREFDPALALADAETMERAVADSGARISFALLLLGIAAGTALLLGAIGIYGVISYTVTRRTGEIGVRLALGARPGDVVRMIVRQGAVGVVAGLVLGLLAAVGFGRFMDAILVGVPSTDLVTYGAVAVLLGALGSAAMWIPARRAAAMDPVSALRAD